MTGLDEESIDQLEADETIEPAHLDQIPEGAPSPSSFLPEFWSFENRDDLVSS
jgi:hypothetical protein